MKKILIAFCLTIIFYIPAFAEYKPFPETLSTQYKNEMEQIIDNEYPHVIKNIDNLLIEAKNLHDRIIKNGFNLEDYINLTLIAEVCIPAADLDLYAELMKVTQEKYVGIKYQPIGTDSTNPIDEYLYPYMENNNVNRKKLIKIINYENKQILIIEKYINEVEKLRP